MALKNVGQERLPLSMFVSVNSVAAVAFNSSHFSLMAPKLLNLELLVLWLLRLKHSGLGLLCSHLPLALLQQIVKAADLLSV